VVSGSLVWMVETDDFDSWRAWMEPKVVLVSVGFLRMGVDEAKETHAHHDYASQPSAVTAPVVSAVADGVVDGFAGTKAWTPRRGLSVTLTPGC